MPCPSILKIGKNCNVYGPEIIRDIQGSAEEGMSGDQIFTLKIMQYQRRPPDKEHINSIVLRSNISIVVDFAFNIYNV